MEIRKGPIKLTIFGSRITCDAGSRIADGFGHIEQIETISFDAFYLDALIEALQEARQTEGVKRHIARLTDGLI